MANNDLDYSQILCLVFACNTSKSLIDKLYTSELMAGVILYDTYTFELEYPPCHTTYKLWKIVMFELPKNWRQLMKTFFRMSG